MIIKGVFFDFDGVIADTEYIWIDSVIAYTSLHSINLKKEELLPYAGCDDFVLKNRLMKKFSSEKKVSEAFQCIRDLYEQQVQDLKPREGIVEWLKQIRDAGLFSVIVSNGNEDSIRRRLKKLEITEYFEGCVTPKHSIKMKPNPDLYLEALKLKQCSADEVICLEDSIFGLMAAESAGIYCVLTPTKFTEPILTTFTNPKIDMSHITFLELSNLIGIKFESNNNL